MCTHYREQYGLETRIVRFHNIFGPQGTWEGGREKAPAALSRKIAIAKLTGNHTIDIWGDGEQTRSFCYIDDCLEGVTRLMRSDYCEPLNLGQDRMVTINELADIIAAIAGIEIVKNHIPGPQGVRGRNSDNTRLRHVLGWEPQVSLEQGLEKTYAWIEDNVRARLAQDPNAFPPDRQ
jgi:nucleoside-diphosphate-sugar epimerase